MNYGKGTLKRKIEDIKQQLIEEYIGLVKIVVVECIISMVVR